MTIANTYREKKQKPHKLDDFVLKWGPKRQSPEQQRAILKTLNAAFGGTEVKSGDDS